MSDNSPDAGKDGALTLLLPAPAASDKASAAPEPPPPPTADAAKPVPPVRRTTWPYWFAAGFILLAGGEAYLFMQQQAHQADKTQLAVLQVEVSDLRANADKTSPVASLITAQAQLAQKQAALAAQLNAVQTQVVTDHNALAALQINAQEIGTLTARMARLNNVAAARMALEAGQPLGVIPNAPSALAVFADSAPPTLAQLKAAFPAVARHAAAVSLEDNGQSTVWARVKLRLEGLITISDGTHVIFGPPAAAALNHMRVALANDDLAGAVAAAASLSAPTQAAMASWLIPAQQLLAAQQALTNMARQGH